MRLTEQKIKKYLFDKKKNFRISDGGGLYLRFLASKNAVWYFRYKINGKVRWLSLGQYPLLSLSQARELCLELRYQVFKGFDPLEERQKQQQSYQQTKSFEYIAREWYEINHKSWKNPKHIQQTINSLENYVFPKIGHKPLAEIDVPQLMPVINALYDKPETADRVKRRIKAVFTYAIQTGKATYNPALHLPIIKKKTTNYPSLPYQELGLFLKHANDYPNKTIALALRFLVLTFVRSGELRLATWEEFSNNQWLIPAHRMKMQKEHIVPLSDWALETLDELKESQKERTKYLFTTRGNKPLSDMSLSSAMKRMGYKGKAVPHGFRATASSCLNESGLFNTDAIERQLAHVDSNKVRGAYNRAQYLEERHHMIQWYADFIRKQYINL